jgi:ribonucleotide reductase beta subunit family protein with ferritin-like domain
LAFLTVFTWDLYKKSIDSFWKVEVIDLSRDCSDWLKMIPDEQHFIIIIIAFFTASDGIVIENEDAMDAILPRLFVLKTEIIHETGESNWID